MGTALVYDDEMTKYKLLWVDPVCEPEVPERLQVSHQALVRSGLAGCCVPVPVREATDEEILLVHSEEYLEGVKKTPFMDLEDLMAFTQQYGDVYFHPNIYHCAKLAIGATLQLVDSVMTGKVRNGMALVRPPGHHSQTSQANGFCVFNNVAIAAQYAKKHHRAKRVLIVDWDIHHGQGIQYCFEDDPSVLYFSWHRYEHQSFWPNLRESDFDSVGSGKGAGFNINVPWNQVGMGNSDYLAVFFHVLLPVAYEFGPDLVLISAGFDSAIGDPEGLMCATPDIFAHLTHLLMNLAGGKVCAVLEGGYNLTSLAQSVCQTVQTLLGDPPPHPANLGGPCESALESVHSARSVHKKYWSCLQHAAAPFPEEPSTKTCRPAQQDGSQGPQSNGGGEAQKEAIVWPEPLQRDAPSVRTALVLPDAVACADGCERFSPAEGPDSMATAGLRKHFLKESEDGVNVKLLYNITALVGQMEKNEIRNGLALVPDVSMATTLLTSTSLSKRVLVVWVGDGLVPAQVLEDEKTLVVHISSTAPHEAQSKYYVPITLKQGCGDTVGLMQAALGLLLPLGYQYAPGLVLLVRLPGCRAREDLWLQLTGLLQGLAAGHTLVLVQENETASVGITASCLLGNAAPSLGSLAAPGPEDVESFERLRLRLQTDWPLLQTTAPDKRRSNTDVVLSHDNEKTL
ncbi:Histone deacetylase 10 [Merluccius polli]|uniref:Histone deacetylase 10 n=1 Tax=Merluccius polli TaxID=89951 RepID=A0AA47NCI2_MERPO|nr:Histone deacetylase 10 [Merluccius polli]